MSSATWQRLSSREEFESRTLAPLKLPNIRLNELTFPSPPSTPNSIQLSPSCSFQSVSWSRVPSVDSDYFSGALSGLSITSSVSSAGLDLKRKASTTNLDTRLESSMRSLLEPQQQQLSLPPISHILNAVPSPFEHQLSQHRPQTSSGHPSPRFAVPFPQGMFTPLPSPTCSISSSSTFPSQAQRSQPPSLPRSYSVPDVCYNNLSASLSMTSPQKKRQASTTFESGLSSRFSVHAKKLQVRPSKSHRTTSRSSPYEGAAVLHRSSGSDRKSSTCSSTSMSSSSSSSPYSPGPATDDETSEVPDEETSASSSNNNNSKGKKQNIQYTPEQNLFIIYHKDDLELPWAEIEKRYNARFPGFYRTAGGLNCNYYRLNAKLPRTEDSDKFSLIFDERPRYDPENPEKMLPLTWDEYEGVRFQTVHVQVRQAAKVLGHPIGLMWRCPEELVKGENEWVLEEHRVKARELAARRRYQREAWKRSQQLQQQHQQQQEQQYNQQHHQQTYTFKAEQFR
ncbi:hypothetical protein QBC32DRAFT_253460 [Pseudoneurospora amorphoporcata]|uniref:Uncharacterized protein n=1 Tax=Pseudoneurospora amorphoporcata TaxID=241081 RepID=A0AAN6SJ36_9PEZI|nr:hypothetical protein QBC32DRAFT_253460 [Pseudoneurospora amorphoporcata]